MNYVKSLTKTFKSNHEETDKSRVRDMLRELVRILQKISVTKARKWQGDCLLSEITKLWPTGRIQFTACFYKVFLEHSHIHSFMYQPQLLFHDSGKAELLQQTLYSIQSLLFAN